MLTVNPVYVLHAFLRNISENFLKCLLTNNTKRRREKALSQYTNFNKAIVCLHDWQNYKIQLCMLAQKPGPTLCLSKVFFMCNDQL